MGNLLNSQSDAPKNVFYNGRSNNSHFDLADNGEMYDNDDVKYDTAQQLEFLRYIPEDQVHQWLRCMSKSKRNLIWAARTGRVNFPDVMLDDVTHYIPLRKLTLFSHGLSELPDSFSALTNLTHLDLSDNRFGHFPISITLFTSMQRLELHENHLVAIPPQISTLHQLSHFSLWSNHLTSLPVELYQLTQLECLQLNNNRLTRLDTACTNLKKIHNFTVRENCFRYPKVYEQGFAAIVKYFRISTVLLILKTFVNDCFPNSFPEELIFCLCDLMIRLNYS